MSPPKVPKNPVVSANSTKDKSHLQAIAETCEVLRKNSVVRRGSSVVYGVVSVGFELSKFCILGVRCGEHE
jgi:hypothetical protein